MIPADESQDDQGDSQAASSTEQPKPRGCISGRLKAYFLTGVLITAPLAITIAVASWFINFVDSRVVPLIPGAWNPDTYLREHFGVGIGLPGLGLVILLIGIRSEEHTSELQSLMRTSYAVFCLKKKTQHNINTN